jgi:carbonic anhydrase/acetyltransferase-like protein (isoleucine patch superfamily)
VQDLTMVHVNEDAPVTIGNEVTIGHSAIIHGTVIGDRTLIGMGAIIMSYSEIGEAVTIWRRARLYPSVWLCRWQCDGRGARP